MNIKSLTAITLTLLTLSANAQKKTNTKKYNWEAGLSIGTITISGDVASKAGLNLGAWISKPINKWFSVNARYNHGTAKGINWLPAINYSKNTAWADKYAAIVRNDNGTLQPAYIRNGQAIPAIHSDQVFYNYKTTINEFQLFPKFSLWFPFKKPILGIHLLTGLSIIQYKAKVDALDANGNTYATFFNTIDAATSSKSETLKKLKAAMDGVYETNAEAPSHSVSANFFAGMGITVRVKSKFTVGIEYYLILTNSDLLDGQRWQEHTLGDPVLTRDKDRIENLSLNIGYRF